MRQSPPAAKDLTMFISYGWYFRSIKLRVVDQVCQGGLSHSSCFGIWDNSIIISSGINIYMGGTSQDVKRLKKEGIFTLHTFGFLDHLHLLCFYKNYHAF